MTTRKIKDEKDISTNELIFFKGHAKETCMSDGTTVEDAINNVSSSDIETRYAAEEYVVNNSLSSKKDALVSGADIKTINGESVLGSGDINISSAYPPVNHGTSDTTFTLSPNTFHIWYEGKLFTLSLDEAVKMLYALEVYASKCYDNTQYHISILNEYVTTEEELDAYDYRSGYPDKLYF